RRRAPRGARRSADANRQAARMKRTASAAGEAVEPVRRDVSADLEHELVVVAQRDAARVAVPRDPVPIGEDRTAEPEQARARERPSPHTEEVAEGRTALEADDARGVERPEPRAAVRADADLGRDDHDPAIREELDVDARAGAKWRLRALRMDRRARVILRAGADRSRYEHGQHAIALLAVLTAAGCGGSGGSPTIAVQPARQFRLDTIGLRPTGHGVFTFSFRIVQPNGRPLTKFLTGAG